MAIGYRSGYISLIKYKNKEIVKKIIGHSDAITSLEFSKDGKFLLSSSLDKKINIWSDEEN